MFLKYATLLAFATSTIAGVIEPGRYRIFNVASNTTARTYMARRQVFVGSALDYPGLNEVWDIKDSEDGSYTLQNVGVGTLGFANASSKGVVESCREGTAFDIEPAGNGEYVIKLPNKDSYWNVEPPFIPFSDIKLRYAYGHPTERWILIPVVDDISAQDDYDERWELLQRIGRFLGRP